MNSEVDFRLCILLWYALTSWQKKDNLSDERAKDG